MDNAGNIPRINRVKSSIVRARVEELTRILLDGALVTLDIESYVREREKGSDSPWFVPEGNKPISMATIYRYVKRAEANIAQIAEKDHDRLFARHIGQRRTLFQKAVAMGDVRAALSILQDEATLLNLYPGRRVAAADGETTVSLNVLVQAVVQAELNKTTPPALESMPNVTMIQGVSNHAEEIDRPASEPADAKIVGGNEALP